jgi:uncharacterized iron-regulated membrane protein
VLSVLRQVHRWIGLVLVLPIALVALSGSLLVFRDSYYRARWPIVAEERTHAEAAAQPLILETIERRFAADGVRIIKFPRDGVNAFHVYLADGGEALVDPRSGQEIARWHWTSDPAAFLFELHRNLLMGARGEAANGYAALLLVFLAFSGVLLWIPRRQTTFRIREALPRRFTPASILRSHAASGVLLAAGVVLFAATGAGLVFYAELGRVASKLLDAAPPETPSAVIRPESRPRASWSQLLAAVNNALPNAGPTMYYPGPKANAVMTFRKKLPGELHPNGRSYVLVDPYSAAVVQTIDARAHGTGTRAMYALYPIHAARVAGIPLMIFAAVTGVGLAWLALGGAWSYLARLYQVRTHAGRVFSSQSTRSTPSPRVIGSKEITDSNWSVAHGRQEGRSHTHHAAGTSRRQQPITADRRHPRSRDTRELSLPREDQPLRP